MNKATLLLFLALLPFLNLSGQNPTLVKGIILDSLTQSPLAYANIVVIGQSRGTISNEKGQFSLDISQLSKTDSVSFQYIGYQCKKNIDRKFR